MDLLRGMMANRQAQGVKKNQELVIQTTQKISVSKKKDEIEKGTRAYKKYIIENKPSAKKVKGHFKALVEHVMSSDDDTSDSSLD